MLSQLPDLPLASPRVVAAAALYLLLHLSLSQVALQIALPLLLLSQEVLLLSVWFLEKFHLRLPRAVDLLKLLRALPAATMGYRGDPPPTPAATATPSPAYLKTVCRPPRAGISVPFAGPLTVGDASPSSSGSVSVNPVWPTLLLLLPLPFSWCFLRASAARRWRSRRPAVF